MKAKKKPLDLLTLAELGVEPAATSPTLVKLTPPPLRSRGIMVKNVDELVDALKQRGVI
jgi:electron transfer flavoprotein beta subunit